MTDRPLTIGEAVLLLAMEREGGSIKLAVVNTATAADFASAINLVSARLCTRTAVVDGGCRFDLTDEGRLRLADLPLPPMTIGPEVD